jgi:hypothetical protein
MSQHWDIVNSWGPGLDPAWARGWCFLGLDCEQPMTAPDTLYWRWSKVSQDRSDCLREEKKRLPANETEWQTHIFALFWSSIPGQASPWCVLGSRYPTGSVCCSLS